MYRSLAGIALLFVVAFVGYYKGFQDADAKRVSEVQALNTQIMTKEAARAQLELDLVAYQETLNDAAMEDPDAGNVCLSTGSLQRLNDIR